MHLIKIGGVTLNLDTVTYIDDDGKDILVFFNVAITGPEDMPVIADGRYFEGEEAEMLRWYLGRRADDVAKEYALFQQMNTEG